MKPVLSNEVGVQILKELGVNTDRVVSFSLVFDAGDAVRLNVTYLVEREGLEKCVQAYLLRSQTSSIRGTESTSCTTVSAEKSDRPSVLPLSGQAGKSA